MAATGMGIVTRDEVARRKLGTQIQRLWSAQRELRTAQEDADHYATKLLLAEHGLIVGEFYTFKSSGYPTGFRGRIERAEGFFSGNEVALCLYVTNSYATIRIYGPDIPVADGHV